MIEQLNSPSANVLGFKLSGKLHDADYKTFVPAIDEAAKTGKVRLPAYFHDFHGWDAKALWDDIKSPEPFGPARSIRPAGSRFAPLCRLSFYKDR